MTISCRRVRAFAPIGLACLLASTAPRAVAQDDAPTVLGAVLDTPPVDLDLHGGTVRVFDDARTEVFRNQGSLGWRQQTHYFDAPLEIAPGDHGRPALHVFSLPGRDLIQFELRARPIDRQEIADAMRRSGRNPFARAAQMLPLRVFRVEVHVPTLPPAIVQADAGISLDTPLSIQLEAPSGSGPEWVARLRNGLALTVRLQTRTKLTQLSHMRATWEQVVNTRAYQQYLGPSGPQFITAAQMDQILGQITGELGYFQWQEGVPGAHADLMQTLRTQLFDTRHRAELRLEEAADPARLRIDIAALNKVDVIRRLATDSRNLNDSEWCRKYAQAWTNLQDTTRDVETSVDVFGYFGGTGNGDFSEVSDRTGSSDQSDCGRQKVETSFRWEQDGEQYIPKSIYVINRSVGRQQASGTTQAFAFSIAQRDTVLTRTVVAAR